MSLWYAKEIVHCCVVTVEHSVHGDALVLVGLGCGPFMSEGSMKYVTTEVSMWWH